MLVISSFVVLSFPSTPSVYYSARPRSRQIVSGAFNKGPPLSRRSRKAFIRQIPRCTENWNDIEVLSEVDDWEPIDVATEEQLQEELELFEYESGPVSNIQELVALGLGALLLASFVNICWRLVVVLVSVTVTAFKYSFLAILLVFLTIFFL